jgi:hypothetical protein
MQPETLKALGEGLKTAWASVGPLVGVIIDTYVSLRDQGGDLKLLCPRGRVREVLRVLRLLEIIPYFENETKALASFRLQSYFARP